MANVSPGCRKDLADSLRNCWRLSFEDALYLSQAKYMPRNIVSLRGGDAKGFWLAVDPADADADSKEPSFLDMSGKVARLKVFGKPEPSSRWSR